MVSLVSTQALPPPPIREPIFNMPSMQGAAMNQIWVNWFNQLFIRAGGSFAPTQSDLDVLQGYNEIQTSVNAGIIANLSSQVAANTAAIAVNTADIATLESQVQVLEVLNAYQIGLDHT